jgi:hybrid cluster-associated redox disulfide protein
MKITKDSLIGDVVNKYPKTAPVFLQHGLHCIGCHVATWETLEQASVNHGVKLAKLLKDLNRVAK